MIEGILFAVHCGQKRDGGDRPDGLAANAPYGTMT